MENFGRNITIRDPVIHRPANPAELLRILQAHATDRIRCLGALHSWSPIIATQGVALKIGELAATFTVDAEARRVCVDAGWSLKRLLCNLKSAGWTLPTIGAIKKQTVAGAVATGTHGSGRPSLSHYVERVTLAYFDHEGQARTTVIDSGDDLLAARCALGSMGVVTALELAIVPRYRVKESVRKFTSLDRATAGWNSRQWPLTQFALIPWSWIYLVSRRKVSTADGGWLRLRAWVCRMWLMISQDWGMHALLCALLRWFSDANVRSFFRCVLPRLVLEGPRRVDDSVSVLTNHHEWFRHVEMEIFIPAAQLAAAVAQIRELIELAGEGRPCSAGFAATLQAAGLDAHVQSLGGTYTLHYPLFFRRIETDDTLVSMASEDDPPAGEWVSVSVFTYRRSDPFANTAFDRFAATIARCMMTLHRARLHWGKYRPSTITVQELRATYPRFAEFERICGRYDPARQFWYD
jgi:FAD/FMN-containing dehydrogenase